MWYFCGARHGALMAKWFSSTGLIKLEVAERVAWITLNRPEKRNAVTPEMLLELRGALLEADDLVEVNVIVLAGAGKDFCTGYDLAGVYAQRDNDRANTSQYRQTTRCFDDDCWDLERMQELTTTLFRMHKPVIAKVQGHCVAGGTDLALQCDLVLAADDAKLGFPATRANGSPPHHMWIYHCGPQWAKRLLLTGDCVWGRDAAAIGLVLDAVPAEQLDAEVDALARRMSCVDSELLSAQKRIVNLALELQGAGTLQRLAAEMDARAHLGQGPRRRQFKTDMASVGLKEALRNRDAPFGDGMVILHARKRR
jgi:enoyl-CoA hydratase